MTTARNVRGATWWVLALIVSLTIPTAVVSVRAQPAEALTQLFTSDDTFTVPAGVTSVRVEAQGGRGGNGGSRIGEGLPAVTGGAGGLGGNVVSTVAVSPGGTLQIIVGQNGNNASNEQASPGAAGGTGYRNGGAGGAAADGTNFGANAGAGGGGGGSTAVLVGGAQPAAVVAGGGGGGGGGASRDPLIGASSWCVGGVGGAGGVNDGRGGDGNAAGSQGSCRDPSEVGGAGGVDPEANGGTGEAGFGGAEANAGGGGGGGGSGVGGQACDVLGCGISKTAGAGGGAGAQRGDAVSPGNTTVNGGNGYVRITFYPTTLTVATDAADPSNIPFGTPISGRGTVVAQDDATVPPGAPTGAVTLTAASQSSGALPLSPTGAPRESQTQEWAISTLAAPLAPGQYSLNGTYPGDGPFAAAPDAAAAFTVVQATTTTSITPDPAATVPFDLPVAGSVTVATNSPIFPQGTLVISLIQNGVTLATQTVTNPAATVAYGFGPRDAGAYTVQAIFTPAEPANYAASQASQPVTVTAAASETTIALDAATVTWNAPLTGTVRVANTSPGSTAPITGPVTLHVFEGGTEVATVELTGVGGIYPFELALDAGSYTLVAEYPGAGNVAGSSSAETPATVEPAPTTAALGVPAEVAAGTPTTVTATVDVVPPGSGLASGPATVTIRDAGGAVVAILPGTITDGTGTFEIPGLVQGSYTAELVYDGSPDGNVLGSSSTHEFAVVDGAITVMLEVTPTSVPFADDGSSDMSFTVTVTNTLSPDTPTGTGTLVVTDRLTGDTVLSIPLTFTGTGTVATATGTIPVGFGADELGAGVFAAVATYDGNEAIPIPGNTSNTVNLEVTPLATTTAVAMDAAEFVFGADATGTLTIASESGLEPVGTAVVTVFQGGAVVATQEFPDTTVPAGGLALDFGPLPVGDYTVTAAFTPSSPAFLPSATAEPVPFTVTPAPTQTEVTLTASEFGFGAPITGQVAVTATAPSPTPNGGRIAGEIRDATGAVVTTFDGTIDENGMVAFEIPTAGGLLTLGATYDVVVTYLGNESFEPSVSEPASFTVVQAQSATTVAPDIVPPDGFVYGADITGTVTVTNATVPGGDAPTGGTATVVARLPGGATVATATVEVVSGQARFTLTPVPALDVLPGGYELVATYNGDEVFAGSTSPPAPFLVAPAPTQTVVTPSSTAFTLGEPFTGSVEVTRTDGGQPEPGGGAVTIIALDPGGMEVGRTGPLPVTGGPVAFTIVPAAPAPVGSGYSLVAQYVGAPNFQDSSGTATFDVLPLPLVATLTPDAPVYVYGAPLTGSVAVEVAPPATGAPPAGDAVNVHIGSGEPSTNFVLAATQTVTLDAAGEAPFSITDVDVVEPAGQWLPVGDYTAFAEHPPQGDYGGATSPLVPISVIAASTETTLDIVTPSPAFAGTAIETVVTVTNTATTPPPAGGQVVVRVEGPGGPFEFTAPLSDGIAAANSIAVPVTIPPGTLGVGEFEFSARYEPPATGANFEPSETDEATLFEVIECASSTTLTLSDAEVTEGAPVTATADVVVATPGCAASPSGGTVEFTIDGEPLGSATVASPAALEFTAPAPGTYQIDASFLGVEGVAGSEAAAVTLVVVGAPTPPGPGPTPSPAPPADGGRGLPGGAGLAGVLPFTGASIVAVLLLAGALLGAGGAATAARNRRRRRAEG